MEKGKGDGKRHSRQRGEDKGRSRTEVGMKVWQGHGRGRHLGLAGGDAGEGGEKYVMRHDY